MIDLSKHTRTGRRNRPKRLVLMGTGGVGKTTFAAQAASPYFVFTEEGEGELEVAALELREDDPVIRGYGEFVGAVDALLTQEHDFKTFVLDTIDGLEDLVFNEVCARYHEDSIEKVLGGYGKGYTEAKNIVRSEVLPGLDALRRQRGMDIIILGHVQRKRFEEPDVPPHDRYMLRCNQKIADAIQEWADVFMFAYQERNVVEDTDSKDKKKKTRRAVGKGERVMITEERPFVYGPKNRHDLPITLPLDYRTYAEALVRRGTEEEDDNNNEDGETDG